MNMKDTVIKLENVHKYYGKVHALRGLNLAVQQGEVFGFLGPNGAGKTTTIRCMLDFIRPNSGSIQVLGFDPQQSPQEVKAKVGYLPGDLTLEGDFTARKFIQHLYKLKGDTRSWTALLDLAERLDLSMDQKIESLSHGNRQKVGLL